MYPRQGNESNNTQPPWLVRAEVTIRHGTPGSSSETGQVPVVSSSVTDSSGVRMVYRWNTNGQSLSNRPPPASTGSFGFQRGNILFTSTPPARPPSGFTVPRSGSSGNEDSTSSRPGAVSDSGYNSEQYSPSYPTVRRPSQCNRRCKSTCSIVLSNTINEQKKENIPEEVPWRLKAHQHLPRSQFSTVPEVCEECAEGGTTSSGFTTHFCTRLREKFNPTSSSKDAASQTTDIESKGSSSTISRGNKIRRKATGLRPTEEQKKKKQESLSPIGTPTGTTGSSGPQGDSEKSDSSTKDSSKRKSRTVHIDVYCTGSDDDATSVSSSEDECDTPITVFENPDVKVTHTQASVDTLPRGFQDDKAFLKRASERRCESFRHTPMRMPSLASSKGYDSDDLLSSLYPSQFSSYTALQGLDSAPWSAASSNAAIPFDYDSTIATSSKDTFSDIESILNNKANLTPCDSFEYANSLDRERIRRMEEIWARAEKEKGKTWRSPHTERRQLLQAQKVREYLESHPVGWSSEESGEESDESGAVGWSFVSSDDGRVVKKNSTVRRASRDPVEIQETDEKITTDIIEEELERTTGTEDQSDTGTRSDSVLHPYSFRDQIGPFGSKSPSPLPSKMPSRVTSPFTTPQGEKTDHILKASRFGPVISAFRKPGHHIGPAKNPSCLCEHCRRYFDK